MRESMSTVEAIRLADFSVLGCSIDKDAFGFSVGPLGLSGRDARMLASKVAEAIHMLNSLLLEESGVKLKYAEFELTSRERGNFPEAMVLVTGGEEEASNFMMLLEHEKGLVDVFKLMDVADEILNKLSDVKLACKASGLSENDEKNVIQKFVERFARKMYAEVSQRKYREKYARDLLTHLNITSGLTVEGRLETDYSAKEPRYNLLVEKTSLEPVAGNLEYLESFIFTKTALEVLANDVALIGAKILSLINDYTLDEVEDGVVTRLADAFWSRVKLGSQSLEELLEEVKSFMDEARNALDSVKKGIDSILYAGERKQIEKHLESINETGLASCFKEVLVAFLSRKASSEDVWGWQLKEELTYFLDHAERGLKNFERATSAFIFASAEKRAVKDILSDYIRQIVDPVRKTILNVYLEKTGKMLENFIEERSLTVPLKWDVNTLKSRIKDDLSLHLELRFRLPLVELLNIAFSSTLLEVGSETREAIEETYREIKEYVSEVVPGLADYLLSHNVLKVFLEQNRDVNSPELFSQRYFDFISSDVKEYPKWEKMAKIWLESFPSSVKGAVDVCKLAAEFVKFINKLRDEGTSTEKARELIELKIKMYQERVEGLTKKLSELDMKKISIEKQIDVLQSQLSSTELMERNLKIDYSVNIASLQELRKTLEAKKAELKEIEQKAVEAAEASILERKSTLEKEIKEIAERSQCLLSEIERIDRELNEVANSKERFKDALKQLHAHLEEMANQIATVNAEIEKEETLRKAHLKFLERYLHVLEEEFFLSHVLKNEVLAFARDKIASLHASITLDEGFLNEFKDYARRLFLKSFSRVQLKPLRLLLLSTERKDLNYVVMYNYPTDNSFRMIIGNNFLSLKE
ncbi:MAG: hypothetical protein QXK43_03040 [Candidatus Jordarchaeales archaeon]